MYSTNVYDTLIVTIMIMMMIIIITATSIGNRNGSNIDGYEYTNNDTGNKDDDVQRGNTNHHATTQ